MKRKLLLVVLLLLMAYPLCALAQAQAVEAALPVASYEQMLNSQLPREAYQFYRWDTYPDIYVIHFENYRLQGETVNRIAAYIEKAGMRGNIISWRELEDYLAWNGYSMENLYSAHDYRTRDLARFFNAIDRAGEELNSLELELLEILNELQLLTWDSARGSWVATGDQAVLSFATRYLGSEIPSSRVLGKSNRAFEAHGLYHEICHGLYFTEPAYAMACRDYWQSELSDDDRRAIRLALWANDYDPTDEELMINEWQAYLLTPPFEFIGITALTSTLRRIASGQWQPHSLSFSDRRFLKRHGPELAEDLESWMADDLRQRLGPNWALPEVAEVAGFRRSY